MAETASRGRGGGTDRTNRRGAKAAPFRPEETDRLQRAAQPVRHEQAIDYRDDRRMLSQMSSNSCAARNDSLGRTPRSLCSSGLPDDPSSRPDTRTRMAEPRGRGIAVQNASRNFRLAISEDFRRLREAAPPPLELVEDDRFLQVPTPIGVEARVPQNPNDLAGDRPIRF